MTEGLAIALLDDLSRWRFGELLGRRAGFTSMAPERLEQEVRAYRYGILTAVCKSPELRRRDIAEPRVEADWQCCLAWADFAAALQWSPEAERLLAERFLGRLGPCSEAMNRFARGKAFKYGRRVLYLLEKGQPLEP